jgi:hypothetical protein
MTNDKRTVASEDGTCIKFIIKKYGKRYNSKTYGSYEQARSYVRKKLRSDNAVAMYSFDKGWVNHNNPSIGDYGYKIEKRAS